MFFTSFNYDTSQRSGEFTLKLPSIHPFQKAIESVEAINFSIYRKAGNRYVNKMGSVHKRMPIHPEELDAEHDLAWKEALDYFESNKVGNAEQWSMFFDLLLTSIEVGLLDFKFFTLFQNRYGLYTELNIVSKTRLDDRHQLAVGSARLLYFEMMREVCGYGAPYVDSETLEQKYQLARQEAIKCFETNRAGAEEHWLPYLEKLENAIAVGCLLIFLLSCFRPITMLGSRKIMRREI